MSAVMYHRIYSFIVFGLLNSNEHNHCHRYTNVKCRKSFLNDHANNRAIDTDLSFIGYNMLFGALTKDSCFHDRKRMHAIDCERTK